ncbi:MAG: maleate isomerase [Paraglaciecola sp.]|jgi:maleate isomerase
MYTSNFLQPRLNNQYVSTRPTVGLIVLTTDLTCERDFSMMSKGNNLEFDQYVNRIRFVNPMTQQNLRAMLGQLSAVAADILPSCSLDTVVFCCTSASALIGEQEIQDAIWQSKPKTKVITTASASVASLLAKGYSKISLLTPYSKSVSQGLAKYFNDHGVEVVSLTYMDIKDDRDVARLSVESITAAAKAAVDPSTEALFISCTAMRVVEIRKQLEKELGLPIFSSNYSTFWQTMKAIQLA